MKKILFYLFIAFTINMSAQSTTYFSKPLELEKVPVSTSKSDSVLVRGLDKIIKFVPRSEFGGSASTPTLDQVLSSGNSSQSSIYLTHKNGLFSGQLTSGGVAFANEQTTDSGQLTPNSIQFQNNNNNGSALITTDGTLTHQNYFKLPTTKPNGEYTLATLDDISGGGGSQTLQQTLTNGNTLDESSSIQFPNMSIGNYYIYTDNTGLGYRMNLGPNALTVEAGPNTMVNDTNDLIITSLSDRRFAIRRNGATLTEFGIEGNLDFEGYLTLKNPATAGNFTMPVSVNGNFADPITGNIEIAAGGGSQTLQQTLDNGASWVDPSGKAIYAFDPEISPETYNLIYSNGTNLATFALGGTGVDGFGLAGSSADFSSVIQSTSGKISLIQRGREGGADAYVSKVIFNDPIAPSNAPAVFHIPSKISGDYTFATLDDIAITKDGLNNSISWNSVGAPHSSVAIGKVGGSTYRINLQSGNDNVFINNTGIDLKATNNAGTSSVRFVAPMPSGVLTYNFPKTAGGNYNVATEDYVLLQSVAVFEDSTTEALSAIYLDASYSQAKKGDKVNCLNITTGAIQYERTSTGWIQHSVTVVQ